MNLVAYKLVALMNKPSTLNHEPRDDSVEHRPVEVLSVDVRQEIRDRDRRLFFVQADNEVAKTSLNNNARGTFRKWGFSAIVVSEIQANTINRSSVSNANASIRFDDIVKRIPPPRGCEASLANDLDCFVGRR